MSNHITILRELVQHGTSTYDALEQRTGMPRNKIRWACNALKTEKKITQVEDAMGGGVAWRITEAGRQHLSAQPQPSTKSNPQSSSKEPQPAVGKTPAAGANGPRVAGGQRPASPVGESATVIEAAKRDKKPAKPASDTTFAFTTGNADLLPVMPPDRRFVPIKQRAVEIAVKHHNELAAARSLLNLNDEDDLLDAIKALKQAAHQTGGKTIHIKPCVFCGFDDVTIDEVRIGGYAVDCPECEAIGPIKPTTMEAISFWNDRRSA